MQVELLLLKNPEKWELPPVSLESTRVSRAFLPFAKEL